MQPVRSVILLDVPEGVGEFDEDLLERMGHEVLVCHGPQHKELCPILQPLGHCPMVDEAHGIVFELDLDRPQHRAILRRYQEVVKEGIPIRVVVQAEQAEKYADLLAGVEVMSHQPTAGELDAFSARVEAYERTTEPDPEVSG